MPASLHLVAQAKKIMQRQTKKNQAPAWSLTELAIAHGKALAKRYHTDERLVLTSLYLAHTVFSPIWAGAIQQRHPQLSAAFAKKSLQKWGVSDTEQEIILNAIEAHHGHIPAKTKVAEVMKNAECYKFVTVEGCLLWLHELGRRHVPYPEAVDKVLKKMRQKERLLTLPFCNRQAKKNITEIKRIFSCTT